MTPREKKLAKTARDTEKKGGISYPSRVIDTRGKALSLEASGRFKEFGSEFITSSRNNLVTWAVVTTLSSLNGMITTTGWEKQVPSSKHVCPKSKHATIHSCTMHTSPLQPASPLGVHHTRVRSQVPRPTDGRRGAARRGGDGGRTAG